MSVLAEPRRPRLLAQNRKLRHLKGLSLRNLTFTPTSRQQPVDDAAALLGASLARIDALSKPSLPSPSHPDGLRLESLSAGKRRGSPPPLPPRRTSLSLAHASPASRQKRLEMLVNDVVGDVFFSLHVDGDAKPVYISETREGSANFNFAFFNLKTQGPSVSRASSFSVRVWSRRPNQDNWVFVLDELVDLRQLNSIASVADHRFSPNALIFHLEDGVYSLDCPPTVISPRQVSPVTTSSYSALMKLANLEGSIQDGLETLDDLRAQIGAILEQCPPDFTGIALEDVSRADKYVSRQQRANRLAQKRRDELRASIAGRRAAMEQGREVQARSAGDMESNRQALRGSRDALERTEEQIRGQRRRICLELTEIFPITPVADAAPLSFRICDLPLPNSTYDAATARAINEDVLSAALGLAAVLTSHLQLYLAHPLPYPLRACGSRSMARDDISQLADQPPPARREFPLYLPRGGSTTAQWRFEYGWFLLNKDIEALCASQGRRVVDIRHSLPNLKYLLYFCSAGTRDVPERKRGAVIRGLEPTGPLEPIPRGAPVDGGDSGGVDDDDGTEDGYRAGSEAGNARGRGRSKDGEDWVGDGAEDASAARQKARALRSSHGNGTLPKSSPRDDGPTAFTLRTKGLREYVAEQ